MMGDKGQESQLADTERMRLRAIRVPDETWQAAQERAKAEGTTVSAIVREALEQYGKEREEDR